MASFLKDKVLPFYRQRVKPVLERIRIVHIIYAVSIVLFLIFTVSFTSRYLNPFQRTFVFYFWDGARNRWTAEERRIAMPVFADRQTQTERIVEVCLQGPLSITARRRGLAEVRVTSVLIDGDELVLNWNRQIFQGLDLVSERMLVGSLLRTIKADQPAIHKVRFLFAGQTFPFLKGAFDYEKPIDIRGLSLDSSFDKMLELKTF